MKKQSAKASPSKKKQPEPVSEDEDGFESYDDEEEEVQGGAGVATAVGEKRFILYEILGLPKDSTAEDIKKAYRKLALLKHPDKNPGDAQAAENFHQLQKAYEVLGDPKRRERYDRYGDEEEGGEDFTSQEWLTAYEYYRAMHPELSKKDIKGFAERYRGSKDEEQDLIEYYHEHEGNVTHILENIICSENADVTRFLAFYEQQIKDGALQKTQKYEKTKAHIKLLPDERAEAKKEKKLLKEEQQGKPLGMKEKAYESLFLGQSSIPRGIPSLSQCMQNITRLGKGALEELTILVQQWIIQHKGHPQQAGPGEGACKAQPKPSQKLSFSSLSRLVLLLKLDLGITSPMPQEEQDKKKQKGGASSMADLEKMILAKKENSFKGFMGYMEAKYGAMDEEEEDGKKKRGAGKKGGAAAAKEETVPQKRKKTK